jgi:transposase
LALDGVINSASFLAYIEQMLCPTLQSGDIVICDNLATHKVSGVREATEKPPLLRLHSADTTEVDRT